MRPALAALASAACSLRYCVADVSEWWIFAALVLLVYAWHRRDD